ncbi:amino acid efflux permease RhtB family protein [Marinobacterium nitratireducens]|uniref:Amino acid efflux permease RhtB family protein n=1 Tax=Marinobacterium nitratireducens TaxID=518897 RepID=A0A917ZLI9_9GAMM|nr:LysE family translocator [Marinobacterium nitratireducens]GGO85875.1 amino acid efflux permease RhtB family protein [Marinobacterium nitratireducens]
MTWVSWLSLCAICGLGAISPGPSLAVVLRHTLNGGRGHGIVTGVCHAAGVGLWALATVAGLSLLVVQMPQLYLVLTWAGAGYLAWLGVKALRSAGAAPLAVSGSGELSVVRAGFDGFMISLFNPKLAVFFLALFSQFVTPGMPPAGQMLMIATAAVIDGLWYSLVALVLSGPALLSRLNGRARLIDRVTGVILLLLALRVITL